MKIKTKIIIALIMCITLCFLFGCSAEKNTMSEIDTLIVGTTAEILTANRNEYNFDVISGTLSQASLVSMDENGNYKPMLADYSTDDSKTWTFTLKDGVNWDDGVELTSDDVKFTLEYLAGIYDGGYAKNYKAINVVDSSTIELVLEEANVRALSSLTTMRLIPKHIYEGTGDMSTVSNELANIGCGPYKYVGFDSDAGTVTFTANADYIDGMPNVKNVIFKTYSNADTMYMALKSGEIDMVYVYANGVDANVIDDLKASGNITLQAVKDTSNTAVLVFNNSKAPTDDIAVRKAIAKAIDYDKFRELFGTEYSVASNAGFVPVGTAGYIETDVNKRDLDEAKKLLDNKEVEIELLLRSDKPIFERYGELLQANLLEAGIKVKLVMKEVAEFRSMSEKDHTNQSLITKFTAYGMSMSAGMGSSYLDGRLSSNAQGQVMDSAFAEIVDRMKNAANTEAYLNAASDCQKYYAENVPAIAFYWDSYVQAYSNKLSGFTVDGTFGILNYKTWYSVTKG